MLLTIPKLLNESSIIRPADIFLGQLAIAIIMTMARPVLPGSLYHSTMYVESPTWWLWWIIEHYPIEHHDRLLKNLARENKGVHYLFLKKLADVAQYEYIEDVRDE